MLLIDCLEAQPSKLATILKASSDPIYRWGIPTGLVREAALGMPQRSIYSIRILCIITDVKLRLPRNVVNNDAIVIVFNSCREKIDWSECKIASSVKSIFILLFLVRTICANAFVSSFNNGRFLIITRQKTTAFQKT